jgi:hypothetical protein
MELPASIVGIMRDVKDRRTFEDLPRRDDGSLWRVFERPVVHALCSQNLDWICA